MYDACVEVEQNPRRKMHHTNITALARWESSEKAMVYPRDSFEVVDVYMTLLSQTLPVSVKESLAKCTVFYTWKGPITPLRM